MSDRKKKVKQKLKFLSFFYIYFGESNGIDFKDLVFVFSSIKFFPKPFPSCGFEFHLKWLIYSSFFSVKSVFCTKKTSWSIRSLVMVFVYRILVFFFIRLFLLLYFCSKCSDGKNMRKCQEIKEQKWKKGREKPLGYFILVLSASVKVLSLSIFLFVVVFFFLIFLFLFRVFYFF